MYKKLYIKLLSVDRLIFLEEFIFVFEQNPSNSQCNPKKRLFVYVEGSWN